MDTQTNTGLVRSETPKPKALSESGLQLSSKVPRVQHVPFPMQPAQVESVVQESINASEALSPAQITEAYEPGGASGSSTYLAEALKKDPMFSAINIESITTQDLTKALETNTTHFENTVNKVSSTLKTDLQAIASKQTENTSTLITQSFNNTTFDIKSELGNKLDGLGTKIENSAIETNNHFTTKFNSSTADIKTTLSGKIDGLNTTLVQSVNGMKTNVGEKTESAMSQIRSVAENASLGLKKDSLALQEKINCYREEVQGTIGSFSSKVTGISDKVSGLATDVGTLRTEITSTNSKMHTGFSDTNAKIESVIASTNSQLQTEMSGISGAFTAALATSTSTTSENIRNEVGLISSALSATSTFLGGLLTNLASDTNKRFDKASQEVNAIQHQLETQVEIVNQNLNHNVEEITKRLDVLDVKEFISCDDELPQEPPENSNLRPDLGAAFVPLGWHLNHLRHRALVETEIVAGLRHRLPFIGINFNIEGRASFHRYSPNFVDGTGNHRAYSFFWNNHALKLEEGSTSGQRYAIWSGETVLKQIAEPISVAICQKTDGPFNFSGQPFIKGTFTHPMFSTDNTTLIKLLPVKLGLFAKASFQLAWPSDSRVNVYSSRQPSQATSGSTNKLMLQKLNNITSDIGKLQNQLQGISAQSEEILSQTSTIGDDLSTNFSGLQDFIGIGHGQEKANFVKLSGNFTELQGQIQAEAQNLQTVVAEIRGPNACPQLEPQHAPAATDIEGNAFENATRAFQVGGSLVVWKVVATVFPYVCGIAAGFICGIVYIRATIFLRRMNNISPQTVRLLSYLKPILIGVCLIPAFVVTLSNIGCNIVTRKDIFTNFPFLLPGPEEKWFIGFTNKTHDHVPPIVLNACRVFLGPLAMWSRALYKTVSNPKITAATMLGTAAFILSFSIGARGATKWILTNPKSIEKLQINPEENQNQIKDKNKSD